jgi:hypothetical protein
MLVMPAIIGFIETRRQASDSPGRPRPAREKIST